MEVDVTISETLHKDSKIYPGAEDYEVIRDQDDGGCRDFEVEYTKSFEKIYKDESFTLEELLEVIPNFLESIKPNLDERMKLRADVYINACKGWVQDEFEVVENN